MIASSDDDHFLISDPVTVASLLGALVRSQTTVAISFDAGHDILLTLLLEVDTDNQFIYADVNSNEAANRRLLAANRMIFTVLQDGVTIRWAADRIEAASFDGRPAFRLPLPESLRRIQRRACFRIATPAAHPVLCSIRLADGSYVDLPLIDISAEGMGVTLPHAPGPMLARGMRFDDCQIDLPEVGTVTVAAMVQNVWEIELRNGKRVPNAGLAFLDLAPRTQSILQRYVTTLDRQRIATRPRH